MSNPQTSPLIQSPSRCIDTLRLSDRDRALLLAHMERQLVRQGAADQRDHRRYRYQVSNGLGVEVRQNGSSPVAFAVWPRNLSASGVCFLHGGFLYDNTPVTIALTTMDGKPRTIDGRVARCRHVSGKVHEIGVLFDEAIKLERFVDMGAEHEIVPGAQKLGGTLAHLDTDDDNRRLIQTMLEHLGAAYGGYESSESLLGRVARGRPTILLVDESSAEPNLKELIGDLRLRKYHGPIAVLTPERNTRHHRQLRRVGASHVMVTPLTTQELAELLLRHLNKTPGIAGAA